MNVVLLANAKDNAPDGSGMRESEYDSWETIEAILDALRECGHCAEFIEGNLSALDDLQRIGPDLVFNISEGYWGDGREAQIPAMLEMAQIPYTGSSVLALALTLDKSMTKKILAYHGLPTPPFQIFKCPDEPLDSSLIFPLFVKPNREGSALGIGPESIVNSESCLRRIVARLMKEFEQPILVEEFIQGREITVGVVDGICLPPLEVDMQKYSGSERGLYSHHVKMELCNNFHYLCPAPLADRELSNLYELAQNTFEVTGCFDFARVDFRLAKDGPQILEINALPGLNPRYSDICLEAYAANWTYAELIGRIVDSAVRRYGL